MFRVSSDTNGTLATEQAPIPLDELYKPGTYVSAVYDEAWYAGSVIEVNEEKQDLLISFMCRAKGCSFKWPQRKDECWVPVSHVLCILGVPTTATGRQYMFSQEEMINVEECFKKFCQIHQ